MKLVAAVGFLLSGLIITMAYIADNFLYGDCIVAIILICLGLIFIMLCIRDRVINKK